ncbi:hypothetical protein AGLY_009173 [Aphis glycines]|uniref:Uncharacterized protein n=1 Tax=Aphis glycines TaxID=307491 RepID=A0A6G0TIY4_APHGL|nr:hypothetical protein AGLY_009173 [Aphis glycines]
MALNNHVLEPIFWWNNIYKYRLIITIPHNILFNKYKTTILGTYTIYEFVVRLLVISLWILSALIITSTASVYGNKLSFYVPRSDLWKLKICVTVSYGVYLVAKKFIPVPGIEPEPPGCYVVPNLNGYIISVKQTAWPVGIPGGSRCSDLLKFVIGLTILAKAHNCNKSCKLILMERNQNQTVIVAKCIHVLTDSIDLSVLKILNVYMHCFDFIFFYIKRFSLFNIGPTVASLLIVEKMDLKNNRMRFNNNSPIAIIVSDHLNIVHNSKPKNNILAIISTKQTIKYPITNLVFCITLLNHNTISKVISYVHIVSINLVLKLLSWIHNSSHIMDMFIPEFPLVVSVVFKHLKSFLTALHTTTRIPYCTIQWYFSSNNTFSNVNNFLPCYSPFLAGIISTGR